MTTFKFVTAEDVHSAIKLELAGFPADEAASLESLQYRQMNAPDLFRGAYENNELIAFVCATLTQNSILTHESMSNHTQNAPYIAIHSVCVSKSHQRQGIATALLKDYLQKLQLSQKYLGARLIAHQELIKLYEGAGFILVGSSQVVHGSEPWFELKVDFVRSPGLLFTNIDTLRDAQGRNINNIYCPRGECRCLLLLKGAAKFVAPIDSFSLPALPHLIDQPPPTTPPSQGYWSVSSPLSFENIGFSRNTVPPNSSSKASTIKYLICADCDLGPLGWHDTEGRDLGMEVAAENEGNMDGKVRKERDFLLAVERLRYKPLT